MLDCVERGLLSRNPKPYLRAVHAWHPSLVRLDDGTLLAGFDLGQAVESLDYRTYTARSRDGGRTWGEPRPPFDDPGRGRAPPPLRPRRGGGATAGGFP